MNNSSALSSCPRVLHITASSMIGGGPEHVWQLVRHLPTYIVSFIAAPDCTPYGPRFANTVGNERLFTLPQRQFTLRALCGLVRFVRQHRIDIIHSHGRGAGVYGRTVALLTRTSSVHTFHGIHLPHRPLARRAYLVLERMLCMVSHTCIAVSDGEAEQVRHLDLGVRNLVVIPNGVEIQDLLDARTYPNPFTLVHISRFDPVQKNSLWLIELALALRQANILEKCRFVLVGDGEQLPELRQRIRQAGMEENFQIMGSQPSVLPFLQDAGCLISTSRWEGLPLAVLEAQALGVPALVTDVVGNKDAIEDGVSGFVYPLDNTSVAVKCITRLLDGAVIWQKMCVAAHTRASALFSVDRMAQETAMAYKNTLRYNTISA